MAAARFLNVKKNQKGNCMNNPTVVKPKQALYKTAQAVIGCAHFKAGDFVRVELMYPEAASRTPRWYMCNGVVAYPEHHLCRFTF